MNRSEARVNASQKVKFRERTEKQTHRNQGCFGLAFFAVSARGVIWNRRRDRENAMREKGEGCKGKSVRWISKGKRRLANKRRGMECTWKTITHHYLAFTEKENTMVIQTPLGSIMRTSKGRKEGKGAWPMTALHRFVCNDNVMVLFTLTIEKGIIINNAAITAPMDQFISSAYSSTLSLLSPCSERWPPI